MKLFTNENNPAALKVLIASCIAGNEAQLEIVPAEDARFQLPRRLPVLQLPSGARLFSANAAVRFFLPPGSPIVDEWLQLEATQIAPLLAQGAGKLAALQRGLSELLGKAEAALAQTPFLTGATPSAADVCLWSSLYPILSEPGITLGLKVSDWFARFGQDTRVAASLARVLPRPGVWSLANLSWIPAPEGVSRPSQDNATVPGSPAKEAALSESELATAREIWQRGPRQGSTKPVAKPVLPVAGQRNVLITSALPYVNNVPHLGNIIGCVLSADVFARFCRLRGYNTLYICGTDEYGTATETKALEEGLTPRQICDKYHEIHADIYNWFNIEFDQFGRTTTIQQAEICQQMFLRLKEKELVFTQATEQLLCQACDRFLADRFVEGTCPRCGFEDARGDQCDGCGGLMNAVELIAPRCKTCSARPVVRLSEQFYLDLPKIEPKLAVWLERSSEGWSHNARVIAKAWLKDGLKPRCITRDLKWGIPVPLKEYADKVFYVWFDAPIGYVSMTACYTDQWRRWWQPSATCEVSLYQFMAKDNVPFHSVMFPSTLLGLDQGHTVVSNIMATEYLNYEDGKFSKSRGVGVFGNDARDTGIEADVWRFYLLFVRPEQQDSSFGWVDLATKVNCELLNNLGNFVNRALMFAEKSFEGRVPETVLTEDDLTLAAVVNREVLGFVAALDRARLRDGIRHILSVSRLGNQFMQSQQPWVLLKGDQQQVQRAGSVIGMCCQLCALLATLLHPYMPATAARLAMQLNSPPPSLLEPGFTRLLPPGHKLGKASPLFTKIEAETIEKLKSRFAGNQKARSPGVTEPSVVPATNLQEAVNKQAELVRSLKTGGAGKAEVAPHVATLLELKKQLALASPASAPRAASAPSAASAGTAAELEVKVAAQAELVRSLKTGGAGKAEVAPHVATLLELKKQLALASPASAPRAASAASAPSAASAGTAAELEVKVAAQAELVRSLKTGGAGKAEVAPHVATLLELKKQLALASPASAPSAPSAVKSKKKAKN